MSIGHGGSCRVVAEDERTIIYEYEAHNLNVPEYKADRVFDGMLIIDRSILIEPEIHEKIKRFPNGKKKLIVKRICKAVPYIDLLKNGKIEIRNCSHCWQSTEDGYDVIALKLLWKIFCDYQEYGVLPEKISLEY